MDSAPSPLDPSERRDLIRIARQAIEETVAAGPAQVRREGRGSVSGEASGPGVRPDPAGSRATALRGALLEPRGAFVSIHVDGRLRGCVGMIVPADPLHETVRECARAAATCDSRFPPLASEELPRTRIEISVLTPPVHLDDPSRVEVGRHGLIVSRGTRRGLLLPQVAIQEGWDAETFLDHTCRKAGLALGEWRRGAHVEVFEAIVIDEETGPNQS